MPVFAQDVIHKLEVGSGYRVLKTAVALVAIVALGLLYDMAAYQNFSTAEAMDAAQLARNISEGQGFETDVVRPLGLYLLATRVAATSVAANTSVAGNAFGGGNRSSGTAASEMARVIERCPDLSNAPAYPLVLAGVLKVRELLGWEGEGASGGALGGGRTYGPEIWIAGFNQLLLLVCACLVFSLGRRLFDEPVGWVSGAAFVGAEVFWRHSVSGLPTLWLTLLVLVLAHLLVRMDVNGPEKSGPRRGMVVLAVCVGLVTAAAGLTRYALLALIIPVVVYVLTLPTRVGAAPASGAIGTSRPASPMVLALAAGLAFLALVIPWLARNYTVSGTLFGTASYAALAQTAAFPGDTLMRSFSPDFDTVTTSVVGRKILLNLRELWLRDLPGLGGSWVTALFLAGLVVPFRNVINSRLRLLVVGLLGTFVVAQSVVGFTGLDGTRPSESLARDYLTIAAPLVFIFGISLLFNLLEQFTAVSVRYGVLGVFFVLVCAPLILTFAAPRSSPLVYPPYYPPYAQAKAAFVPEEGWMASDMPWAIAWYGDRKAVWLPLKHGAVTNTSTGNDFYSLHRLKPFSGLHLTAITMSKLDSGAVAVWRETEGTDADWEAFRSRLQSLGETASGSNNETKTLIDSLKEVYLLAEKHWVRGAGLDWESFVLGILVTREVPVGFPLKVAPLGIMPEILLTDSEHPATKTIKVSEQADRP